MTINKAGLDLIKSFESCRLKAYKDSGGIWTCGWGSIDGVGPNTIWTQEEADARLLADLSVAEKGVAACVPSGLSPNQSSALICFAFNVGVGALKGSTLLKLLKAGDVQGAADQILRWVKDNGKTYPGLVRRRQAERKLFLA